MKKIRTNDQMLDMLNGETRTVVSVDGDSVTFDNGKVLELKKVEACFQFLGNDTPLSAPVASINGDEFVVDGENVEIGIMTPIKVVATLPGRVLLAIKNGDKKDLISYSVESETFDRLAESVDDINVVYDKDDALIYSTTVSNDRKVKDEEDDMKTMKDYSDRVVVIKNGEVVNTFCNMMLDELKAEFADESGLQLFFTRSKKVKTEEDVDGYEFNILSDMEGVDLVEIFIEEEKDEDGEVVDTYASSNVSHYGSVSRVAKVYGDGGFMIVTGSGIHVYGRRHMAIGTDVLTSVMSYPTLVRFTPASHEHNHDTFVLANANYDTVTIRVEKVGGPVGYVTKIEK